MKIKRGESGGYERKGEIGEGEERNKEIGEREERKWGIVEGDDKINARGLVWPVDYTGFAL